MADYTKTVPDRYRVVHDKDTGAFSILDTWHESIKNIADLTQEIPDDSPAIKILNAMEVNALVGMLVKLGWMDKMVQQESQPITEARVIEDIRKIAIERIHEVVKIQGDDSVAKEAVMAIRAIAKVE